MNKRKSGGEVKMNYIQPTQKAFIIPQGTTLKRQKESRSLRESKNFLKGCLVKEESTNVKRVYSVEVDDE